MEQIKNGEKRPGNCTLIPIDSVTGFSSIQDGSSSKKMSKKEEIDGPNLMLQLYHSIHYSSLEAASSMGQLCLIWRAQA